MDLPTCPSCGQSVLDDDATECPFCGAAMDGSSPAKKPAAPSAAAAPAKQKTKKEDAAQDDDDPFAIQQAPTAKKVIPCARKPVKGRLHRVVCPMCDAQGFIPKRAVGHQVKCPNPDCLVPVFTAPGPDSDDKPKAPARVSDEKVSQSVKASPDKAAGKSPLVMYGVAAGVLLVATLGLVFYLNKPAPDSLGPANLPNFPAVADDDDPEVEVTPPKKTDEPEGPDYQKESLALVEDMINAARVTNGNRDKSFCRRLTADAWLRLGDREKADAEFQQMLVVAAQDGSDHDYFRIGPLVTAYWTAVRAGDQATATTALDQAKALTESIPDSRGDVALRSGVRLAAVLAGTGQTDDAFTLINRLQGDVTVDEQQDSVRYGAWTAAAQTLRDAGRTAMPPLRVFAWHRPLATAVGLELAVHEQWDAATQWAAAQQDPLAAGDTFAIVATEMNQAADAVRQKLARAAEEKGPEIALRTWSSLALTDPQWLTKASAGYSALPEPAEQQLGTFAEIIKITAPDLGSSLLTGHAIADYITATLAVKKEEADVSEALTRLYRTMTSAVPPTPVVRKASGDIGRSDSRLKKELAAELKLSDDSRIRTQFNSYRRGMDRIARAAEERRLAMLQMLVRIVTNGGTDAIKEALKQQDSGLRREIMVDHLSGLLFTAAAGSGGNLSEAADIDRKYMVPIARVTPLGELAAARGLVDAWKTFQAGDTAQALAKLEVIPKLTGLCSATANFMVERATLKSESSADDIAMIKRLRNGVWQEQAYEVIGRHAVRKDQFESARSAIRDASTKPAGMVSFLHGLVCGAVEKMSAAPSADDAKEE